MTDNPWLTILCSPISWHEFLLYFYSKEASYCLWSSLIYDAILLLLNLYLYRYTYFFVSSPLFSFSLVLMFSNPCLRSIINHIMWTAISFFTIMYELRICKNAFTTLVCKIYVQIKLTNFDSVFYCIYIVSIDIHSYRVNLYESILFTLIWRRSVAR